MVFSTAINATHFAYNVRIAFWDWQSRGPVAQLQCAFAVVGEHDFAIPAYVKQAVGDLKAEKTQGTSCIPYSDLKRLPNVAITFFTKVFNAAPSRWCLSQHGTGTHDFHTEATKGPYYAFCLSQHFCSHDWQAVWEDVEYCATNFPVLVQTSQNSTNPLLWKSQQEL